MDFVARSAFLVWLTRIAVNRAYNAIRDETRRAKHAEQLEEEMCLGAEPRVESRDLARKVIAILEELGPAKELALLLQAEGHSIAKIAEICQEPRGTILSRISRSRAELSLRMAEAGLVEHESRPRIEDRSLP